MERPAVSMQPTTIENALAQRGLSVETVARVTRVSIHDLRALTRGDLSKIAIGYLQIFAYMTDLKIMLGRDFVTVKER